MMKVDAMMIFGYLYLIFYFSFYHSIVKHTFLKTGKYIFSLAASKEENFEKQKTQLWRKISIVNKANAGLLG